MSVQTKVPCTKNYDQTKPNQYMSTVFDCLNNPISLSAKYPSLLSPLKKTMNSSTLCFCFLVLLLGSNSTVVSVASTSQECKSTYIIQLDITHKPPSFTPEIWHKSLLTSIQADTITHSNESPLLYSYTHAMHGFSATLTPSQLTEIENHPSHLATFPDSYGRLFTTHTTKFLGLKRTSGLWPSASYGNDIIVGIIDSGIWPESDSFSDEGMPPVPDRWKGRCESGEAFSPFLCNSKLIGARSFSKGARAGGFNISKDFDYESARDYDGHGTHTASTAAGNYAGASHFGYAPGTASGVAPGAHLAMYKVFWANNNEMSRASDALAGMDQAIADGVDIISVSLGFDQTPYFEDVIAIASLSATERGIVVVCSAGNDGPSKNSTYNGAPWITTVGAGTVDRSFLATLTLANGFTVEGLSYFPNSVYITDTPLYYGSGNKTKEACFFDSLDPKEVTGKVVLCNSRGEVAVLKQMAEVQRAGAVAGIFSSAESIFSPEDFNTPSLVLQTRTGDLVRKYATNINATVKEMRFVITKLGKKRAPEVAFFSSRGPDPISPTILKPDIIAPGEDILAAVAPNRKFMESGSYELATDYALYSGTSMSAPHVAGVAALLKAVHKDWSPAAIRSAIMTTAEVIDNRRSTIKDQWTGLPATPLEFGAGHINPNKAMDPGLIYDLGFQDYVEFLCSLHYDDMQMSAVIRRSQWSCSENPIELNYPSFLAIFPKSTTFPIVRNFSRVVTNVGHDNSIYHAVVEAPKGLKMRAEPDTLSFINKGQKQEFVLTVEMESGARNLTYAHLKWVDQHKHIVSSPVVVLI